jgi:hypothetical protein
LVAQAAPVLPLVCPGRAPEPAASLAQVVPRRREDLFLSPRSIHIRKLYDQVCNDAPPDGNESSQIFLRLTIAATMSARDQQ